MKRKGRFYDRYLKSGNVRPLERRIELVTIGLAILLLVQLLLSGLRLAILSEPDPISPSMDGVADAQLISVASVSATQSDEIRARPLFWVSRRPVANLGAQGSEQGGPGSQPESLKNVKLVGLFGSGETAGVIVVVEGKQRRILIGEQVVDGWTLYSVQRNEVELANGARHEKLILLPQIDMVVPQNPTSGGGALSGPGRVGAAAGQDASPHAAPAGDGAKRGGSVPRLG